MLKFLKISEITCLQIFAPIVLNAIDMRVLRRYLYRYDMGAYAKAVVIGNRTMTNSRVAFCTSRVARKSWI